MKVVMTLATAALLATVGVAGAGDPMALTDAQLDQVTGGEALATLVINRPGKVEIMIEIVPGVQPGDILVGKITPKGEIEVLPPAPGLSR